MKKLKKNFFPVMISILFLVSCQSVPTTDEIPLDDKIAMLENSFEKQKMPFTIPAGSKIESIYIDDTTKTIEIITNKRFSYRPFRENSVKDIYNDVRNFFGPKYYNYDVKIYTMNYSIDELIPNFYRSTVYDYDFKRLPDSKIKRPKPVTRNISSGITSENGLYGKNVVVWHSHGWYYNHKRDRWLWQRARLFQTVEDLGPMAFTIPYIIPMLENAGANVFVPRERDVQINEVVIDNNGSSNGVYKETQSDVEWKDGEGTGFAYGEQPYPANYNPFIQGTYRVVSSSLEATADVSYIPEIPEQGKYAVYISYHHSEQNVDDARYSVYHTGGVTEFEVNQQIGGETWIYLGTFKFNKGSNPDIGKVVLKNQSSEAGRFVTTDAVRFGGGMGIVSRNGRIGGRPKFVEASRYWLQYAGMPDTLVYNLNNDEKDYNDDYQSRGEYVNYLVGKPSGPNKDRMAEGLKIPIDVSLAFHTDAGVTKNDTVVGILSIYSIEDAESLFVFPDGVSRLANRDLADILQTQIVDDIRAKYDPIWNRRQLMEAQYSEAFRPNVPAVLLELLSHQNFLDVQFMNDPQFRFDASRSIYKSILKFLSVQYGFEFVVQPLPVTHITTSFTNDGEVTLSWKPQSDPLEATADPANYKVYTKIGDNGFDNGVLSESNSITFNNLKDGVIYSYKITALNDGGESFPSEELSVCRIDNGKKPVLIINGFDRISTAEKVWTDTFSGFVDIIDEGVPDRYDIGYVGSQHDYNPSSKWKTDDIPGHGASFADQETKIIAGNTFNFPFVHGSSIKNNGFSFVSVSDEAVMDNLIELSNYEFIDIILGEEKETHWQKSYADSLWGTRFKTFPAVMQERMTNYLNSGGNIFISGAYVGSDMFVQGEEDAPGIKFAMDVLKYKLDSDHAVRHGDVISIDDSFFPKEIGIKFNTEFSDKIYKVEAPDAIGAVNGSKIIFRYSENLYSAAIAYKDKYGVVVFGFPFETIMDADLRDSIMKSIMTYFEL